MILVDTRASKFMLLHLEFIGFECGMCLYDDLHIILSLRLMCDCFCVVHLDISFHGASFSLLNHTLIAIYLSSAVR